MTPQTESNFGMRTTSRTVAMAGQNHVMLLTFGILILLITLLGLAAAAEASAPINQWWSSSYLYREKITVAAGSVNVPTQYSVRIQFNHAALVTASKSLSSGNDIRIVYWNGSTWTELDRRLDDQSSWNSATTQVWFRTQAAISANQRDDNYYMYYGYSSAGTPPTTWSNIFLFYDDFNDASFDTGRWTCASGTCTESGGNLTLGTYSRAWATATYAFGTDTRWETRVQLGGDGSVAYFDYCGAGDTSDWTGDWTTFWTDATTHYLETANGATTTNNTFTPTTPTSFHVYTIDRVGTSSVRFYHDGTRVANNTTNLPDANLRFITHNDTGTASGQIHDWVRVRKYLSPEPANFTGGEEVSSGFSYRKPITIDYTKVICSSGVTEFPALISLQGVTEIKTTANGGHVQNTNAYDITFRASDGATVLDHEVEQYDGTAGTLVAWVRVPVASGTTNTVLYMYYGNSTITSPTQNPNGVWNSNYITVQHMNGASYTALDDSTSNHNDVTTEVSGPVYQATGKIGYSAEFDGNDAVEIQDSASLDITSQVTVSAWISPTTIGLWDRIVAKSHTSDASPWTMYGLLFDDTSHLREEIASGSTQSGASGTSTVPTDGSWTYATVTYDHTALRVYFNGSAQGTPTNLATNIDTNDMPLSIGRSGYNSNYFTGRIDEVRVSNIARSACWIQTEYNNINSPSTFYTVGSEQEIGLLTFNSKYVVTSTTAVTTTSGTLADDTQASQTFSLTASKTVLVIYQANSVHGAIKVDTGIQNAISVDSVDYAKSWDSGYDTNYAARNTVFWIGTLGSGSHTIKGRFASNTNGSTVTISNRALLIYIFNGDQFRYLDSATTSTSSSTTLGDDPEASFTFMPSGACKALVLYNLSNAAETEQSYGKKAAISINSSSYGRADKSPATDDYADSVFTVWALSLSASSTTVKGQFAANYSGIVTVNRRQLGVLLFADSTLLDTVSSDTTVTTTSASLVDDAQATISRTTTDPRELLVVAAGIKRDGVASSSLTGFCYGISVDGSDKTNSRGSPQNDWRANSAATAWGQSLAAAGHTVQGRFSNNNPSDEGRIESRRIAALWLPVSGTADVTLANHAAGQETDAFSIEHSLTGAELFAFKLTNNMASGVTVDQIQFQLSGVTGITQSDFANLKIYIDSNNNGTIDAGETTTVGGTGVVNAGVTTITFTTDFSINAGATVNYILKGDVSNLVNTDTVTLSLGANNITLTSGTVSGTAPTNVTETSEADPYSFRKQITIDGTRLGASCGSVTNTWQIAANNRDAYDDNYGSGSLSQAIFGDSGWDDGAGFQWAVTIPQGATITSARVKVYSTIHNGSAGAYTARIRIEDVDSASAFTGTVGNIYSRGYWGTTVDWSIPSGGLPTGTWSNSPDIKDLIQHIVNRAGWSSGNYLGIAIWGQTDGGNCNEELNDYSDNPSLAAQLEVTYEAGGTLTNFPVLVKIPSDNDLRTVVNGGDVQNANGYDIVFRASNGTTVLDHEVEKYVATTGELWAWVRIPTLDYNDDTIIYLYYGNSSISTSQENKTGVWGSNYLGVWHLKETSGNFSDSTGRGNDGADNVSATGKTGKIGSGQEFDGSGDYIDIGDKSDFDFGTSDFTASFWIYKTSGTTLDYIMGKRPACDNTLSFWNIEHDTGIVFEASEDSGVDWGGVRGSYLSDNNWHYVQVQRFSNTIRFWINGTSADYALTNQNVANSASFRIGGGNPCGQDYNGYLDEVRISSVARDACWIGTDYNNQNWPNKIESGVTGFLTVGSEQDTGTAVNLANHGAGQETDAFGSGSSVTGAELFGFKLANSLTSGVTVDQVQFQLSSVSGIVQGDFANLAIYVDANNDGTIGVGETTTVGGTAAFGGMATITFSTDFTISAGATVNYILKGDVSNLTAADTVTIALGTSNVTLTSGTVGGSAATNVTHTADAVSGLTQIHYRWRNDDGGEGLYTGDGADGAISLAAAFNLNTTARAGRTYPDGVAYRVKSISGTNITLGNAGGATLANTNGIAAGDEILIINLQGSSGDNGSVGNYEFLDVQSVSGGIVTVVSSATKDYDGSGNSFTTQKVFVQRVPNYTNVTTNAYSIMAGDWDGGTDHNDSGCTANTWTGIVVFRANGTVTVSSGGSISTNAKGYRGGSGGTAGGINGESYDGSVGSGGADTQSGSGGGTAGTSGGGGSSNYTSISPAGTRGGGGGGGNCDGNATTDGAGGAGGGGYGGGGGGGGGGADDSNGGGAGGAGATTTGVSAGGGGNAVDGSAGGTGGAAGSAGGGTSPVAAAGSGATTGQGGRSENGTANGIGAGGGGGGGTYGNAALTTLFLGSGGGQGGTHNNGPQTGATGGNGGGIVFIIADTLSVSGTISSNGTNGGASSNRSGASGGGAGGSIMIQAKTATLGSSVVTANGGSVGSQSSIGGGGGGGGVGRIRVEADTKTGTTSPTYSGAGTPGGTSATWAANEDTKLVGLAKGTIKRIRFEISNEGATSSGAVTYQLQVAQTSTCGSGTYSAVPTDASGHWQIADSTYITDGQATQNISGLTDEATTFVPGQMKDGGNTTGSITLAADQFTELEFAVKATSNAIDGADYCFRLVAASGTSISTYVVYGQVSIAGPNLTEIHYRWRNDDGAESGLDTGTGADGAVTVSTLRNINTELGATVTTVTANPSGTSISVTSTTGISAGDEILLINMQGTSSDNADVGNYEFLRVASVPNSTTLNVTTSVQKSYDGTTFSNQKVVVQRVPQWTNVTISSGGTLTANDWAGSSGGIIVFRATGTVDVQSGGTIRANALGYRGGTGGASSNGGFNGESYDGTVGSGGASGSTGTSGGGCGDNYGTNSSGATRGGGGGGGGDITDGNDGAGGAGGGGYGGGGGGGGSGSDCSSGGGAGGAGGSTGQSAGGGGRTAQLCAAGGAGGTNGSQGGNSGGAGGSGSTTGGGGGGDGYGHTGGAAGGGGGGGTYGTTALTTLFSGSGGGGGGGDSGAGTDRNGGDGGGIIYIIANTVTVSGSITSNGADGSAANSFHGASGSGSGGSILIQANSAALGTSLVTAAGGATAASASAAGGGGGGGVGRIRVEAGSLTGTTNPSASIFAAWWNASWSKRKTITIDNTANSNTLTNYQVQVTVTYDSDMQVDFDDIRFTNASGTELDYWLYSKTDGVSATFWVEVDSIAASSNTTIYMYYGNASVTTTSNAKNTMFIYENMDSAPTTGTLKGTAYYDATNKWMRLTTTAAGPGQFEYSSSPTPGFVAEWRFWTGGGTGADASWLYDQTSSTPAYEDSPTNGYSFTADEYEDQLQVYYNNNATKLSSWGTTTIDNSTWHDAKVVFYQSGGTYYYQFSYDGTQRISSSSTNVPSGNLFGWGARIGGSTNEHRIDDLVVRKYTSPEPGVSTGTEQGKPTAGASWMANEDTKLTEAIPGKIYRLRFEVSNEGTVTSGAVTYKLQVAQTDTCGSGTYTDVLTDTSGHFQIINSSYLTDGGSTTDVVSGLTNESTTFVPGQVKDTGNTTGSITLNTNQFTELEFAIQATDNVLLGANYCFRLVAASGTSISTYSAYGQIGISACEFKYHRPITLDRTKVAESIEVDVSSSANTGASAQNSLSWSHTVTSSGNNRILIVGVSINATATPAQSVYSVTYGGAPLTQIGVASRANARSEMWYKLNPATGANNVVVTLQTAETAFFSAGATSFINVDQSNPIGTFNVATNSSTTPSVTVTSASGELVVDTLAKRNTAEGATVDPSQTQRWYTQTTNGTNTNNEIGAGSTEAGAASVTMSWSFVTARPWALVAVPLKPSGVTNFPLLVSLTDATLKTVANGGHVASSSGYDIIFKDSNDDQLDHEIEKYDGSTGELVAWVRIPYINGKNASSDTVIYMYYGNNCIISSQEDIPGVWDLNFKGVWHLKESGNGTAGEYKDSTSNANNAQGGGGTSSRAPTQTQSGGKIGPAQDFNRAETDFIRIPDAASLQITGTITMEAWVKSDAWLGGDYTSVMGRQYGTGTGDSYQLSGAASGGASTTPYGFGTSGSVSGGTMNTGTWYHVAVTFSASASYLYVNGVQVASAGGVTMSTDGNPVIIGGQENDGTTTPQQLWDGIIDEVRISNAVRTYGWIQTEYNNQNSPSTFYSVGSEIGPTPTSIDLLWLRAKGQDSDVLVTWETAQEINNFGFHVYRAESVGGPYTRITDRLIPGLSFSVRGRDYSYVDRNVTPGGLYYYKLEDIDFDGTRTMHGPVCVDWDGDGIPDDWEINYGLDPTVDDSGLDPDGDGLSNLQEYYRGTNPLRLDTDGDGVRDSHEEYAGSVTQGLMRGVEVIASDATGMTLELRTESFESVVLDEGGVSYRRLKVPEYVHGYTDALGKPELPVKGILIDLPAGKGGLLSIESVESKALSNYWIYPVPEKVVSGEGELATVTEVFFIDDAAYRTDSFYPDVVARAGETYDYRGQKKLQVFFNPFSFNPVTKELIQYTKIRVRVEYVALAEELPVVRSGVPLTPAPSGLARAVAWVPPEPASAYKMLVSEEGIYRLTSAWLTSQGASVSDWSQVRVYNLGQEIPIYQGADYIEFYGVPPAEVYSKYTKHNVYWLTTSGGSGTPLRMTTIDGTPGTATIPGTHVFTVHTEEDKAYWGGAPGAESLDRWVSDKIVWGIGAGGGPVDYPVTLPGVGGSQLGQVTALLCGLSTLDHDVEIAFNGVSLGTYQWSGLEFYEVSISDVPLVEGLNTLTLTCLSGADGENADAVGLDWVEVAYPRKYEAIGNVLKITHNAGYRYQIANFASNSLEAYDITTATDVKRITNLQVTGINPYTMTMEPVSGTGERTYLTLSTAALKTPVSITKDTAGDLSSTGNGADYILITHRNLGWDGGGSAQPWLANLKAHREAQGLRVKVVDVEDVYDEFSYGILSPQGIKDFLSYTYQNWVSPAPQYVLLVGDSVEDPKDNYGLGSINYVPTYLAQTPFMGESLTDEWYVRISGNDAIADMDLGRLPASTTAQAETMVNKIISYETTPVLKTWERNTILVADNQVEGYEVLFELMNEDAAGLLPAGMNAPFREYLNDYVNPADLTASMRSRLNVDGALIWNYSGHGSVQVWAENIFSTGDVATLNNSGKLPFVVAMTCLNGFFGYPEGWNWPSLAEVLLRNSNNGAVAAFMSTGMTDPEGQRVLDQALFEGIFKRDYRTLGRAISYAKQELVANSAALGETGKTFLLFGDPAMTLKVPVPTMPANPAGQVSGQSVTITWGASTDANGAPVAGYNVYRSTSPNGTYSKVNTSLVTNTQYTDSTVQSGIYYYVIRSVDSDGYESAATLEMTVTIGARSVGGGSGGGSGGGGGGGCFISSML